MALMSRTSRRWVVFAAILLAVTLATAPWTAAASAAKTDKLLVIGWDGVPSGYPFEFVPPTQLPMLGWMLENGVVAEKGLLPVVPSNTTPSWASILTGAFPGTHSLTNNSYHYVTTPITVGAYGDVRQLEAEMLPVVAEKHGLATATLGGVFLSWPAADSGLTGPVMGWGNY